MTFLSRILGFVRDMVCAHLFGASLGYDAFILAFRIPNMMRRLFAEGAFSQAFVPIISEYKAKRTKEEVQVFIDHVAGALFIALVIVTIVCVIFAPYIIKLFAPGFKGESLREVLAVDMLRITFPYMLFISLTAFLGGILNSYGNFGVPAFTPVFLNLSLIGAAIFLSPQFRQPEVALAWGVCLGGVVQLLFQIPFLLKMKLLPIPKLNLKDKGVTRVVILMGPAVFGAAASQINSLVDSLFASFLPVGSISCLYFADRLMEFPLGIFGIGVATVLLPSLAKEHALAQKAKFADTLDWGVRSILLISIPSACGLYILAEPLIATLFQSGKFSLNDTLMTKQCLMAYSVAVIGIMLSRVLASAFYAVQNIKTPVKISFVVISCNIIFNILLIRHFAHIGIAAATSIASSINAILLLVILQKQGIYKLKPETINFVGRVIFASALFVVVLYFLNPTIETWIQWSTIMRVLVLTPLILLGILVYVLSLFITGLRPSDLFKSEMSL